MNIKKNKLPPYGAILRDRLKTPYVWPQMVGTSADGTAPQIWIAYGSNSWNWARIRTDSYLMAILPPDDQPENYTWSIMAGHYIIIVNTGSPDQITKRLATCLLTDGANRILVMPGLKIFTRAVKK